MATNAKMKNRIFVLTITLTITVINSLLAQEEKKDILTGNSFYFSSSEFNATKAFSLDTLILSGKDSCNLYLCPYLNFSWKNKFEGVFEIDTVPDTNNKGFYFEVSKEFIEGKWERKGDKLYINLHRIDDADYLDFKELTYKIIELTKESLILVKEK